jgi:hypothetical protein
MLLPVKYKNPQYYKDESFLLLTKSEYDAVKNEERFAKKQAVYEDPNFILFTYPNSETVFKELFTAGSVSF